ncbi:MAG: cupin domain-containing protein [Cryomorphaceae bacterium]
MKTSFITLLFISTVVLCKGQAFRNLQAAVPSVPYDNIHVQALDNDSLASTYLIWAKHSVKEHFHAYHTEVVYVLSGKGSMTLGDQEKVIQEGDYIFIPAGTHHAVKVLSDEPMKVISLQTPHFDGSDRVFVDQ